jgi:hypothetical protein
VSIAIKCPGCGKSYSLREDLAGRRVKCKCDQAMKVPDVAAKPDAMDGLDALGSLLDDELPPTEAKPSGSAKRDPAAKASLKPGGRPSRKSAPAKIKIRWAKGKGGDPSPMLNALMGLGVVAGVSLVVAVIAFAVMRSFRPGYASPEEAFAVHQEALFKKNWGSLIRTYSAESQEVLVGGMLMMASIPMIESSSLVQAVLEKHGVDGMMKKDESADGSGKPSVGDLEGAAADGEQETSEEEEAEVALPDYAALAREAEERRKKALSAIEDKAVFYVDFMAAMEAERDKHLPENPMLQVWSKKPAGEARRALAAAKLDNLTIDGDTAEGEMSFKLPGEEDAIVAPVAFKKSDGRWLIHIRSAEDFDNTPLQSALDDGEVLDF